MRAHLYTLLPFALAAACTDPTLDTDGDGITDVIELELGFDPESADGDDDGLNDGQEQEAGTKPDVADTDGDGLSDGDEVAFGTDPTDAESGPYKGGWPMQTVEVKDGIEGGKRTGQTVSIGKRFPRMAMKDQFGDVVDLYDYAGHGKKVFIDISAEWCPPCRALAEELETDTGMGLGALREAVENGDVYWVTILGENYDSDPATRATARDWANDFPNDHIPVLADTDKESVDYVLSVTNSWPSIVVVNQSMTILDFIAGVDGTLLEYID